MPSAEAMSAWALPASHGHGRNSTAQHRVRELGRRLHPHRLELGASLPRVLVRGVQHFGDAAPGHLVDLEVRGRLADDHQAHAQEHHDADHLTYRTEGGIAPRLAAEHVGDRRARRLPAR